MSSIEWDPLASFENSTQTELVSTVKKREIYNILKSYVGFFDPFAELIQNAMDAVDKRERELTEQNYIKKIWVTINLKENILSVTDNGFGFNKKEFETFLCPSVSFKNVKENRGNKGVGTTYIAYGFNYLQLGTKTTEFKIVAEIKNGRKWIDDLEGTVTRPMVVSSKLLHDKFLMIDRGSTFSIKFFGDNIRPKELSWFKATTANQWKYILLLKTPLGQVEFQETSKTAIYFDLEVIDKDGIITSIQNEKAIYTYPHTVIEASADLKDIVAEQDAYTRKGIPAKVSDKYKKLNGIYQFFNTKELLELVKEETDLIETYKITAYGYFCYSTKVWEAFSENQLELRRGTRILNGGLQLATHNMPQGDLITIPLTSNIGYQNQSHIIVHFQFADPDLGRKGFQPELESVAKIIARNIVTNKLKKWRRNLREDTGAMASIFHESELEEWIDKQKEYEKNQPLVISNKNFFLPTKEISITSKPCSEQDVIVLFSQLLAGGVIRGIKLMATDQHSKYDGIFRYVVCHPMSSLEYDKETNPLGVLPKSMPDKQFVSKPNVLEYKQNVDGLISDFSNDIKNEKDIHLVVAWEMGDLWRTRYEVTSLLNLQNMHHRQFHGITHIFQDDHTSGHRFFGIILSELIDYLNGVDEVQKYHENTYEFKHPLIAQTGHP